MLSPGYMGFMVQTAVIIIRKAMGPGIGHIENNQLITIALYMGRDEEAHAEFQVFVKDAGDDVLEVWCNYFKMIQESNNKGISHVPSTLARIIRDQKNDHS